MLSSINESSFAVFFNQAGRDLMFHHGTCDLYTVGSTHEIYRLNLEQGRFLKPFESSSPAINVCGINPAFGWLGFGGADGTFELWDPRERKCVSSIRIDGRMLEYVSRFVLECLTMQQFADNFFFVFCFACRQQYV
jgi:WD40 repeat protein